MSEQAASPRAASEALDGVGEPGPSSRWRAGQAIALAVIVGFQLMLVVDGTIVNVALPTIQRSLGFSEAGLSWVVNSYALAIGGLLLLGGRAGDILGRRRVFIAGVAIFTVSSLLAGLATSPGWLVAARAVQGAGAAFAGPGTLSLIATNFREGPERHRALGAFSAAAGGGGSLGIIVGGMLTEWASWRWVMFVNVPIGLAILLLAPRHVRESARRPGRFDLAGALTSGAGLAALAYAFIRGTAAGWGDARTLAAFGAAAALLAAFLAVERRARQPILPLGLLSEPTRAGAYLNMFLLAAAMIGVFFFLTQVMQDALGFSPLRAGLAFLTMTVPLFAAARTAPRLLARFGPKPVTAAGTALITAAMAWLTQLSGASSFAVGLLGPLLLVGTGVGLTFMPLNAIILASIPPRDAGSGAGLLQAMQRVGSSVGLAVLVAVAHAGGHALPGQAARAFTAATIISGFALLITVFVIRPRTAAA